MEKKKEIPECWNMKLFRNDELLGVQKLNSRLSCLKRQILKCSFKISKVIIQADLFQMLEHDWLLTAPIYPNCPI